MIAWVKSWTEANLMNPPSRSNTAAHIFAIGSTVTIMEWLADVFSFPLVPKR